MKKFGVLLTSIIVAGSLGTTAFADTTTPAATTITTTTEDTTAQNAGITPDSIFYPIDVALDNLKIALTSGTVAKARIELKVADERLSESIVMTIKNKPSLAAQAAQKYSTTITNVEDKLQTELQNNTNTDDTNINAQTTALEQQITAEQQKGTDDLSNIESKVPEETKQTISNIIETRTARAQAVQNMVQKLHALNDARKAYNKAQVALNKAQKSGDTESINAATSTLTASQTAYNQAKEDFTKAFQSKQEAVKKATTSANNDNTSDNSTATGSTQPADTTQPTSTTGTTSTTQAATSTQTTSTTRTNTAKEHNDDTAKINKSHDNDHNNSDKAKSAKDNIHKDNKK